MSWVTYKPCSGFLSHQNGCTFNAASLTDGKRFLGLCPVAPLMLTGDALMVGVKRIQLHAHPETRVSDAFAICLELGVSSLTLGTSQAPGPGKGHPGEELGVWRRVQKPGPGSNGLCCDLAPRLGVQVPALADLGQDKSLYLSGL